MKEAMDRGVTVSLKAHSPFRRLLALIGKNAFPHICNQILLDSSASSPRLGLAEAG
jgi:hypothetical protein